MMKKSIVILAAALSASLVSAEGIIKQFNDLGKGTLSGRLQSLSMYRDYENVTPSSDAQSTTLGLKLDYLSPTVEGWTAGASYIGAGVLDSMDYDDVSNPGETLLSNGRVNLLNEAFLSYNMTALGLTNTTATLGRRVYNGEVFRADDFRQKPRSLEAVSIESRDVNKTRIQVGYATEMSKWQDSGTSWKFENFDNTGTDGIAWGEVVNNSVEGLEVAVFNAYEQDIANLLGARAKYNITENTALLGYYRWERDVGENAGHDASACGLSLQQKMGKITLEGGYFGVYSDTLLFEEGSTGINHALGSSLMIYSQQFNGGADTFYLKATTKLEATKTVLYALYNYTLHDESKSNLRQAQELNVVIKQPIPKFDNLTACFKGGIGTRDGVNNNGDTTASDARLFLTYTF